MATKQQHIAVFRLSAMGDVAMISPIINAFVQQHKNCKITIISRPFFKPFFDHIPNVNFFAIDLKKRHKGYLGLIRLFLDIKKLQIDAFADLHNVLRSKFLRKLLALSGKKTAFTNKGRKEKKELTKEKNKIFKPIKSMIDRHLDTFQKLGYHIDINNPTFPKLELTPKIINLTTTKNNQKWIGIAPFAQYQSKVYPINQMQQVINQLASKPQNKLFLFGGGKEEIETLKKLANNKQNIILAAGNLNLQEELNLISHLDIMLSMDSGNGHIAAMLGIKVITLWGATHPFAGFIPFNQTIENSLMADRKIYPKLPTSVYGNKNIKGYQDAMQTITVQSILEKIETNLNPN